VQEEYRTYDIELGKYNSAKELLIESTVQGSLDPVNYQSESRGVSVTTAAVRMEEKRRGCKHEQGAYNRVRIEWQQARGNSCEQSKGVIMQL